MRKLFIIAALLLITACYNDIPRSKVIFISVAASYGIEGEVNYLTNPPGDQRALSEQISYMSERRGLPYTEHIFLERDGRMSISGKTGGVLQFFREGDGVRNRKGNAGIRRFPSCFLIPGDTVVSDAG